MNILFGTDYASAYDLLYGDKDYAAECRMVQEAITNYGLTSSRKILDLGCGTGSHTIPLANLGYEVTAVDRSEEMLSRARSKAGANVTFHSGDIRSIELQSHFDCALMMFAVLGYQLENDDIRASLMNARRHLKSGGLLVFDVWYGPAVLHLRPSERAKIIPTSDGEIVRFASGKLNIARQLCLVQYELWRVQEDRIIARIKEDHQMRYFFPMELRMLLNFTGFETLRIGAFPVLRDDPSENTWNVVVVAKAI